MKMMSQGKEKAAGTNKVLDAKGVEGNMGNERKKIKKEYKK